MAVTAIKPIRFENMLYDVWKTPNCETEAPLPRKRGAMARNSSGVLCEQCYVLRSRHHKQASQISFH